MSISLTAPHHVILNSKGLLHVTSLSTGRCETLSNCISEGVFAAVRSSACAAICYRVTGKGYMDVNRISGYIPGKIVFFLMQARGFCFHTALPANCGADVHQPREQTSLLVHKPKSSHTSFK